MWPGLNFAVDAAQLLRNKLGLNEDDFRWPTLLVWHLADTWASRALAVGALHPSDGARSLREALAAAGHPCALDKQHSGLVQATARRDADADADARVRWSCPRWGASCWGSHGVVGSDGFVGFAVAFDMVVKVVRLVSVAVGKRRRSGARFRTIGRSLLFGSLPLQVRRRAEEGRKRRLRPDPVAVRSWRHAPRAAASDVFRAAHVGPYRCGRGDLRRRRQRVVMLAGRQNGRQPQGQASLVREPDGCPGRLRVRQTCGPRVLLRPALAFARCSGRSLAGALSAATIQPWNVAPCSCKDSRQRPSAGPCSGPRRARGSCHNDEFRLCWRRASCSAGQSLFAQQGHEAPRVRAEEHCRLKGTQRTALPPRVTRTFERKG
mmetsp:Transcript_3394/g.13971  ORF Transcript_3394/g.13971 Transcript_3394/m.13971 type:complete len:378 (+) Transcript_3394:1123-2256(+)